MRTPEHVSDDAAWRLATAYIDAWNRRDRDAWLVLLHPALEFHPTALVGTRVVYHGTDGAARYFDALLASQRAEQAQIVELRRIAQDHFLIELKLLIDGGSVGQACIIAKVLDSKFVYTAGYFSDARTLASAGLVPEDAPAIPTGEPESA